MAPLDVYIGDEIVVQPDVFWVSESNDQCVLVDGKYWRGAPDLVVEVLSPSNAQLDWATSSTFTSVMASKNTGWSISRVCLSRFIGGGWQVCPAGRLR